MNERIRKLAEQAKQYAREQMDHSMDPLMFSAEVFQTKFAELIIRECALQCNHNDDMDLILEHFEVEE